MKQQKNLFEDVNINRLEKALSNLYSSVYKMDIKVTLSRKDKGINEDVIDNERRI